jgi:hypothetical protein
VSTPEHPLSNLSVKRAVGEEMSTGLLTTSARLDWPVQCGTTVHMDRSKVVVPRPSPAPRVRLHGVQVQVRCEPRLLKALDAARELEQYKPSRPEMLRRLARDMLTQRGLLKIPSVWIPDEP